MSLMLDAKPSRMRRAGHPYWTIDAYLWSKSFKPNRGAISVLVDLNLRVGYRDSMKPESDFDTLTFLVHCIDCSSP